MGALILGALALAVLFASKEKGFKETPEQLEKLFDVFGDGFRAYKPSLQPTLVTGLVAKKVLAKKQASGKSFSIEQAASPVPFASNAYVAAGELHQQGYDLWVAPAKLHLPTKVGAVFQLLFLKPGERPPKALKASSALLIAASDPWPPLPPMGDEPPPPPPPAAPPPPPEAMGV